MKEEIRLGHSPDSDDAFMFYAIAKDKISTGDFHFTHIIEDIESLNKRALKHELEVTAISIHAYSKVYPDYALLSCGASIGDKYGPLVVCKGDRISSSRTGQDVLERGSIIQPSDLKGKKIAIPGEMTTAYLTLRLLENDFIPVSLSFDQIGEAVLDGKVDAGLIIHEGQLFYHKLGLKKVIDLGEWWYEKENLPLPLGANAVRKDLGEDKIKKLAIILKESIQYSLDHREEALNHALTYARGMDRSLADQFVGMYVNDYTLDFGDKGREGVKRLLKKGFERGIIANDVPIEFY